MRKSFTRGGEKDDVVYSNTDSYRAIESPGRGVADKKLGRSNRGHISGEGHTSRTRGHISNKPESTHRESSGEKPERFHKEPNSRGRVESSYRGSNSHSDASPHTHHNHRENSIQKRPYKQFSYKPEQTLFKSYVDYKDANHTLRAIFRGLGGLSADADGMFDTEDCANQIATENSSLRYVSFNHIVELYLRDRDHVITLQGDLVGERTYDTVEPPEVLYFGTLGHFRAQMMRTGLRSHTKRYIKLFSDRNRALNFAERFAKFDSGSSGAITLSIDAYTAHQEGTRFSKGYSEGEYTTESIFPRFIIDEVDENTRPGR